MGTPHSNRPEGAAWVRPSFRPFRAETGANAEPRALPWAIAYGPFGAEDGLPADGVRVGTSYGNVVCVIGPRVWGDVQAPDGAG